MFKATLAEAELDKRARRLMKQSPEISYAKASRRPSTKTRPSMASTRRNSRPGRHSKSPNPRSFACSRERPRGCTRRSRAPMTNAPNVTRPSMTMISSAPPAVRTCRNGNPSGELREADERISLGELWPAPEPFPFSLSAVSQGWAGRPEIDTAPSHGCVFLVPAVFPIAAEPSGRRDSVSNAKQNCPCRFFRDNMGNDRFWPSRADAYDALVSSYPRTVCRRCHILKAA